MIRKDFIFNSKESAEMFYQRFMSTQETTALRPFLMPGNKWVVQLTFYSLD